MVYVMATKIKKELEGIDPKSYILLLDQLKQRIEQSQIRAATHVNTELIKLYWNIGRDIVQNSSLRDGAKK